MSDLKPCPFCGGDAHTIEPARYGKSWGVRCECGAFLGFEQTEAEAIAAWNTRAAMEFDNWFYLPKPKEPIVEERDEQIIRRICEVWHSRAERTPRTTQSDFDFMCSECGKCVDNGRVMRFNYCPNCGARVAE